MAPECLVSGCAPAVSPNFVGQIYYDKNNIKIGFAKGVKNTNDWISFDGEDFTIKRSGTFTEKPNVPRNVGFQYFCTSGASIDGGTTEKTNIPIFYTCSGWVDANGNSVVAAT
jgi:hypothetical protein